MVDEQQGRGQSAELTAGTGFTFEDTVVAVYLSALLEENTAPALPGRIVVRVMTQQASYGESLDDLIVDACGADGEEVRLSLQVKRKLVISAAQTNTDFREIIQNSYITLNKPNFRDGRDRVGGATGTISDDSKRRLETICEWARDCASTVSFFAKFSEGTSNKKHRDIIDFIKIILQDKLNCDNEGAEIHRLLRHFVLLRFDLLHEGSIDEFNVIARLRNQLHTDHAERAFDLWTRLRMIARESAGRSPEFQRHNLINRFYGSFRFAGSVSLQKDLRCLSEEARLALAEIANDVDGVKVSRHKVVEKVKNCLEKYKFVQISGLPGTGKSAIFRELAENYTCDGSVLVLKADRLSGSTWSAYARSIGLSAVEIELMLVEIAATGVSILFIDGLDRIEVVNRGIVLDIVNTILRSPTLNQNWRIVATLRDRGLEPLRTWLPTALFQDNRIATVEVQPFDDEESQTLATEKPALHYLLFSEERVREIARRPFFANVLAKAIASQTNESPSVPGSEIDLINTWWKYGGYNTESSRLLHCQRTLIQLSQSGANTLGRRIRVDNFDLDAITQLKHDGILRDTKVGHSVEFAHDIFFEWSFVQFLIDREENWLEEIQAVGEPPVLGRVIELLSQSSYLNDDNWGLHLERIESSSLRSQWLRAWLLGPLSIPSFLDRESVFAATVFSTSGQRLQKLVVWLQAEKTIANPSVLDGTVTVGELSRHEIIKFADLLAWPSDFATWMRCCNWFLNKIELFPVEVIPDLISVFEVWQNALADIPNPTSRRIITKVKEWLEDIEDYCHSEQYDNERGQWTNIRNGLEELEKRLRSLLLRSARIFTIDMNNYLSRVISRKRLRISIFQQLIQFSPILVTTHSNKLVDISLSVMRDRLPGEVAKYPPGIRRKTTQDFSSHDWQKLAIFSPQNCFFPASPLREPFAALFQNAPHEAQRLVRDLTNHAITAWGQLFKLDWERRSTPIPLVLDFPWGQQSFWGDTSVYQWFRGYQAPDAVESGLMALENWAFSEVENGRDIDEVISDVVVGHQSCAILGIAVALALNSNHVSPTTLTLVTSQRLWQQDCYRWQQDTTSKANLIGFYQSDLKHAEAVRESNNRNVRRIDLRCFSTLFVLNSDEELRIIAQNAIQSFPDLLPFEFEEERQDEIHIKYLLQRAEIWAECGKNENYSKTLVDDGSAIQIELKNPKLEEPNMLKMSQNAALYLERLRILNWVHDCFEHNCLSEAIPLSEAIEIVKSFDTGDLFFKPHTIRDFEEQRPSAVAGVAAVVLCFSIDLADDDLRWAQNIIFQAVETPESQENMWRAEAFVIDHPCLYAVHGLANLLKRSISLLNAKKALIELAGHPLEQISKAAIVSVLEMWSIDSNFAWIMLDISIRLSIGVESHEDDCSEDDCSGEISSDTSTHPIDDALARIEKHQVEQVSLSQIPAPWVFAPPPPDRNPFGIYYGTRPKSNTPVWRDPDIYFRCDFLSQVLTHIPVEAIMSDVLRRNSLLKLCDELTNWTIERISPSWRSGNQNDRHKYSSTELFEWKSHFYKFIARVVLHIDEEETQQRFLDPVFQLDNEPAASLIKHFLSMVACSIMDAPLISPTAVSLIQLCIPHILNYRDWDIARSRDGHLFNFDVPDIANILLFVHVERAENSARFANGDWYDINHVIPIIDIFVRHVGDVAGVTSRFLTLCERSLEHYPVDLFVDQILAIFSKQPGIPNGWRNSSIPSRIATLIQLFAERMQPLEIQLAQNMLRILDILIDMGDRRAAALQTSEIFKDVRVPS
jgi:hypothetical protein